MERPPATQEAGRQGQTPEPEQDTRREEAEKQSERQSGGRDDADNDSGPLNPE